jgi:membrane protein
MGSILSTAKKTRHYVSEQIWTIRLEKLDPRKRFFIKQLRIIALAIKGFNDDNCLTKATALTFYTIFSIVPIFALIFAIAKGFGYEKILEEQLLENYSQNKDVLNNVFVFANKLLGSTKGNVLAVFGIVLLLWSVMKLLLNIENSFNSIWDIKRGRSWIRKTTDYLTIMLVGPVFLLVSGGLTVSLQAKVGDLHLIGAITKFFLKIFAYGLVAGVFTFLYMALPNTKVNFRAAFIGGIIATILFEVLGWAYIKFQIGANRMNAIYGGFAALPLFLIWVQNSWYIVLFGAEIAFSAQNVAHYELDKDIKSLSIRYKKVIALLIANLVAKKFFNGEKGLTVQEIATQLDLPSKLARIIINEFVETKIFVEISTETEKEIVYHPGVTESRFTVKYILDAIERKGVNTLPIEDTEGIRNINTLMKELESVTEAGFGHILVKDIVK